MSQISSVVPAPRMGKGINNQSADGQGEGFGQLLGNLLIQQEGEGSLLPIVEQEEANLAMAVQQLLFSSINPTILQGQGNEQHQQGVKAEGVTSLIADLGQGIEKALPVLEQSTMENQQEGMTKASQGNEQLILKEPLPQGEGDEMLKQIVEYLQKLEGSEHQLNQPLSLEVTRGLDAGKLEQEGTVINDVSHRIQRNVREQVVNQTLQALREGAQQVTMELNPKSLGEITINILTEGDQLFIQIEAKNGLTQQLLGSQLTELRSALQQYDIPTTQIDLMDWEQGQEQKEGRSSEQQSAELMDDEVEQEKENFLDRLISMVE